MRKHGLFSNRMVGVLIFLLSLLSAPGYCGSCSYAASGEFSMEGKLQGVDHQDEFTSEKFQDCKENVQEKVYTHLCEKNEKPLKNVRGLGVYIPKDSGADLPISSSFHISGDCEKLKSLTGRGLSGNN